MAAIAPQQQQVMAARRVEVRTITNPIARAEEKPTRGNAIAAMCAHCVGCTTDRLETGFRDSIRDCSSRDCPLWSWRPFAGRAA